jgi:hypothetical protein
MPTISTARPVNPDELPDAPRVKAPKEFELGIQLIWGVLIILAVLSVALVVMYLVEEWRLTSFLLERSADLLKTGESATGVKSLIEDQEKGLKDGLFQVGQLVLLGIFFPVLTALLGHLFGASRHSDR